MESFINVKGDTLANRACPPWLDAPPFLAETHYLRISEVAHRLGITKRRVLMAINGGDLPFVVIFGKIRIPETALDRIINGVRNWDALQNHAPVSAIARPDGEDQLDDVENNDDVENDDVENDDDVDGDYLPTTPLSIVMRAARVAAGLAEAGFPVDFDIYAYPPENPTLSWPSPAAHGEIHAAATELAELAQDLANLIAVM